MMKLVTALLDKTEAGKLKVRLLGISLSNLTLTGNNGTDGQSAIDIE
jgi:hypothetical protein